VEKSEAEGGRLAMMVALDERGFRAWQIKTTPQHSMHWVT
jgi:hypothetical protein